MFRKTHNALSLIYWSSADSNETVFLAIGSKPLVWRAYISLPQLSDASNYLFTLTKKAKPSSSPKKSKLFNVRCESIIRLLSTIYKLNFTTKSFRLVKLDITCVHLRMNQLQVWAKCLSMTTELKQLLIAVGTKEDLELSTEVVFLYFISFLVRLNEYAIVENNPLATLELHILLVRNRLCNHEMTFFIYLIERRMRRKNGRTAKMYVDYYNPAGFGSWFTSWCLNDKAN